MRVVLGVLLVAFSANPIRIPVAVSGALVIAVSIVSYFILRRYREGILLHNLGMPMLLIVAISTLPAIVAESAIKITQSLSR